ncbi:Telomeric repeat-binding factor 1 [Merluccius polli]|uniref:Telomeric repeat-binding factor n=1 Tax=Merluccius polli TaxID=89951 RepID=A0AA47N6I8_MERPO|nr:Telomeric repeat-binding factor 1 [Merluccius polli]
MAPIGSSGTDESVDFARVTAIATQWMLDFTFSTLCRRFKGGEFDAFNRALNTLEAIGEGCKLEHEQVQKRKIAAFLGRVMHGQQLDIVYEKENVTPLMSATSVWKALRDTVADEDLHSSILTLLYIQSVAVCLEKGKKTMASTALEWLQENHNIPKNMAIKLTTLVVKGDIYHPFLRSFTYQHLLEKIWAYLDTFLAEVMGRNLSIPLGCFGVVRHRLNSNMNVFHVHAAAKVAQSYQRKDSSEEQDESSQSTNKCSPHFEEPKKRLLAPTKQADLYEMKSCKKPQEMDNRDTYRMRLRERSLNETPPDPPDCSAISRGKKKWTPDMDEYLKIGVRTHGEGNWKLILLDHDFNGRTGTMLKDRWRILKKYHQVC